jgi:hypothetical protein
MPYSTACLKNVIADFVQCLLPNGNESILDVGVGAGAYADLLRSQYSAIDACEIWEPYVSRFDLTSKYRTVFVCNIVDLVFEWYDLIVMGDVLEHLQVNDAQKLISSLLSRCRELIVVVPFNCEQESSEGNPFEEHQQPDLCMTVMSQRYPQLELLAFGGKQLCNGYEIGVYVKKRDTKTSEGIEIQPVSAA